MCRFSLTVSNSFANGRNYLTELLFCSPLSWVVDPGIIRPEINAPQINAPDWVQRAGLRQNLVVRTQTVIRYG